MRRTKRRTAASTRRLFFLLAALFVLSAPAPAAAQQTIVGGPVILGGDDLTDHGCVDSAGNPVEGWLYLQRALENISPKVTRANDGSVAALGSAPTTSVACGNAGSAIGVAAAKAGLTVTYHEGATAINAFFTALAAGTVNPKIIWIAGDGAANDLDTDETNALTANASRIDAFVGSGGGLMSHGDADVYGWLSTLLPNLTAVQSGGSDDLQLTTAGTAAFPGVTNNDVNAGPWHSHFQGQLGGLQVLVESTSVCMSGASAPCAPGDPPAPVIIGGAQVTIIPVADVGVTKTDAADPVNFGSDVTYTITVPNNGPSTATGVTVTDTLPAGVTFVSATASQGSCAQSGGTVTCNLGNLSSGVSATVTIVVRPAAPGTITNSASVTSTEIDPTAGNNSASQTTTVRAVADAALTKLDSPDPVTAGGNVTYTATVTNRGPNAASGVTFTDPLPAGVQFVSATASQGTCSQAGGTVTCNLGELASGGSATVTIVVTTTTAGSLTNTGSVATTAHDPDGANNTATAVTTVNAPPPPPPPPVFQPPAVLACQPAVSPRALREDQRTVLRVTLRAGGSPIVGANVRLRGAGVYRSAKTGASGVARFVVTPPNAGVIRITAPATATTTRCVQRIGVRAAVVAPRVTGAR